MSEKNEWKLVRVNEAFGDLMYWLERCERKGHLENCSDLVEPWEAFDYEYVAAPENAPSAPGDAQDAARWRAFERALRTRIAGPGHGTRIKVVTICPMYGDEKDVHDVRALIDAALAAQVPQQGEA